jgi:hypothetical protein
VGNSVTFETHGKVPLAHGSEKKPDNRLLEKSGLFGVQRAAAFNRRLLASSGGCRKKNCENLKGCTDPDQREASYGKA